MNGIRCLFLFEKSNGTYNSIYRKNFFNIEICAKSVQKKRYVNVLAIDNIDELIKKQILKEANEIVKNHKIYVELNKFISYYRIWIPPQRKKSLFPFLLLEHRNYVVVLLLYNNEIERSTNECRIINLVDTLRYYDFMNKFLIYLDMNTVKQNKYITGGNTNDPMYRRLLLYKITRLVDIYINMTIPYGRCYQTTNSPFMNYLKRDIYQTEDLLQSNYFMFYNFLLLLNNDNDDDDDVKYEETRIEGIKRNISTESNNEFMKNELRKSKSSKEKEIICNDILYINSKPPFVNENKILSDQQINDRFTKLLKKFYKAVSTNKSFENEKLLKNYQSYLLLFYYKYSSMIEPKKRVPIINKYEQNTNIKVSSDNTLSYIPLYFHDQKQKQNPVLTILEEFSGFILDCSTSAATIKGEVTLKSDDEQYADVQIIVQMQYDHFDFYISQDTTYEKKDQILKIQLTNKNCNQKILTYYYRNMICPLIGSYKATILNEYQIEINVQIQWNPKVVFNKIQKKQGEVFLLTLPFPNRITDHSLKCSMGKVSNETNREIVWTLPDFTDDSFVKLSGTINFSNKVTYTSELIGDCYIFQRLNYSNTKILKMSNANYTTEYFFKTKRLLLLCSS